MKRKGKKKKVEVPEMNLTPMIDVTFLLLIFFLVGMKFKEPEGKLNAFLPKEKGPPPTNIDQIDPEEELTIRVRMLEGRTYPVYMMQDITYSSVRALEEKMVRLHAKTPDQPVTIDPDSTATYERVIWVLDACVRVGYTEIAFAAPIPKGVQVRGAAREPF